MLQRTIKKEINIVGVGLHSGERVNLTLKPGSINSGINFIRTDININKKIKLNPFIIKDKNLSTTIITEDKIKIGTIEHLMSAFFALGIDNIEVYLNSQEIPIMDGSSLTFTFLIREVGILEQKAEKKFLRILNKVTVKNEDKIVSLEKYEGFKIDLSINFDHPMFVNHQNFSIDFANKSYLDEISRARTFGFMQEVELMRIHNLGLGGNLNNAIVLDDLNVLNPDGLRYEDEFVRHKVLDVIGDLYVIGYPIIGHFIGNKSGHSINNELIRKVLEDKSNYEIITFPNNYNLPTSFHDIPPI